LRLALEISETSAIYVVYVVPVISHTKFSNYTVYV